VSPDRGNKSPVSAERRRAVPLWLMGMTNAPFGMYGGILVISVPQLLNARHVDCSGWTTTLLREPCW
jgi:hypothetical protein